MFLQFFVESLSYVGLRGDDSNFRSSTLIFLLDVPFFCYCCLLFHVEFSINIS